MKKRVLLQIIISIALMVTVFIPFTTDSTKAATTQIGTIDITSGKLNVRNSASSKAKVIGSLKRSDKVTVFSQLKTGWTQIQYGKGKGYISSDYVRFYKTTSPASVKKITDRVIKIQRSTWTYDLTKQQIYNMLSPAFSKDYIDLDFKQHFHISGKNSKGVPLYSIIETEIWGNGIVGFFWDDAIHKPKYFFYHKNGVEYLEVSQFVVDEMTGNYTYTLYLKKEPKSDWKVYSIR
ncbi:SH3 domain-containing protein [Bacillus massiliigorillae]|uniref:SH3 domain-containing protein n=1 Tax=Bacillus massiliigorillae TaxID=1243664 RepID=UPI0003AB0F30|nr:SH3 domain-containing protein [Bacillus massiliigorillae]